MSHNTCQSTSMWFNNWTFPVCFELTLVGMYSSCTVSICTPHLVFFAARLQHSEFLPQRYSPDLYIILHIFNGTILCPLYDLIHSVFKLRTSNILYHWFPKPSSRHSPSTGKRSSSSSSDESPHCSIGIMSNSIEVTVMNLKRHLARHIWPSKDFILINPISRNMV